MPRMKTIWLLGGLSILLAMLVAGCYTQVGSTREDRYSDEYTSQQSEAVDTTAYDSTAGQGDTYFDEYGYPRSRFYLGYYYPSWVTFGVGYGVYDPWCWNWWYADPFWAGYYYPSLYGGWWYPGYGYYPWYGGYGGYGGHGYGSHHGGYASVRQFGSTRGLGGVTRGYAGGARGTVEPAARDMFRDQQLPVGLRNTTGRNTGSSSGTVGPQVRSRGGAATGSRSSRGSQAVRPGSTRGGTRDGVRTPPRHAPRETYVPPAPSRGSGSPAPSVAPRSGEGRSSAPAGGRSSSGGSSGGGGRSSGSTRGSGGRR